MRGQLAILHQAGAVGDADQGAGIVEHVHEQDREHHDQECELTDAREIELQKCGRDRWRHRDDAVELGQAERQTDGRDDEDADQRTAQNAPVIEPGYQYEAEQHQDRRRVGQIAERDQSCRMADHDLSLFERDNSQEETDPRRHGKFQILAGSSR